MFPVTTVGSWPRPPELLRALRGKQQGRLSAEEFNRIADAGVLEALRCQESAGLDVVTDGEQRRDNFYSFVAEKLDGVRLMSLAEMLDVVEDKAGFERILQTLDVPAFSIQNPTCVGRIRLREPLALEEYRFLRQHTDRAIKVPLPGPYLLTRAMWVKEVTRAVYPTKEDLAEDVVQVLRQEALSLRDAGADFIQFDEPVLTELVFTQGQTRTFMCAALAARKDPQEELEFAVGLINRVVEGLSGVRTGLHVCRGNWSQKEETLLRGSYHPLLPYLERIHVQQLVLEYATPRAGDLLPVQGKELGLGVVNPRTPEVESVNAIVARVREALRFSSPEKIFLNPDCGFGTFSSRPMNPPEVALRKLQAMAKAARILRDSPHETPGVEHTANAPHRL
ncbi:MAG: vitamin-B12 independent methionine synthase [Acidobacteria bacterium RIFCSPLOWO2_12_FULL_60_22]|nr:MAG: vitamin-B12 independent methionine synthase [Acidobacteria bacterium RIFCSPLOWO2_12_FULL_60_22]